MRMLIWLAASWGSASAASAVVGAYGVPTIRRSSRTRTTLLRKLKDVFRRHQLQRVGQVVQLISPVLRGWVDYLR
jgi:hypothetical protein